MARESVAVARLAGFVLLVLAGTVLIPSASAQTFAGRLRPHPATTAGCRSSSSCRTAPTSSRAATRSCRSSCRAASIRRRCASSVDGTRRHSAFAVAPERRVRRRRHRPRRRRRTTLMATMRNGPTVHLTITNHPSGGPVFAGPQVQPWICKTVTGLPGADGRAVRRPADRLVQLHGRGDAHVQGVRPGAPPPPADRSRRRRPTRA